MKEVIKMRKQIADLKKEGLALLDGRALTPEEETRSGAIETELSSLNAKVDARAKLLDIKDEVPGDNIQVLPAEKFRSIGEQLLAVRDWEVTGRQDRRLVEIRAATGMSEGIPADGGFAVQTDFASGLLEKTYIDSPILNKIMRIPVTTNANSMKLPAIQESSRTDGYRQGGIRAYWTGEAVASTKSGTKLSTVDLELKKLTGYCALTEELKMDAPALSAWIGPAFKREFSFKILDAIVNGSGVGQPLGILNAPCAVTITAETGQGAATIVGQNIIKMWAARFGPNAANYIWMINQDIEPQLYTVTIDAGANAVPVYMPAGGISGAMYGSLFTRAVIPVEQCATLGTAGDIILFDPSQYIMIEKGDIQSASSIHVKFLEGEELFRFVYRCDGAPWWNNYLTPYKGSNYMSPVVVLSSTRT